MTHIWIVGVDGSDGSGHALEWAVAQAGQHKATVHAVAAWHLPAWGLVALSRPTLSALVDSSRESVTEETHRMLERLVVPEGVRVEPIIVKGSPTSVLLDCSKGAELLVVGSRGEGGFAGLRLGSVSHKCVIHSTIPTVVVPPTAAIGEIKSVVVGMDPSEHAQTALEWAMKFAPGGATIRVVGAWEPNPLATEADLRKYSERGELFAERCNEAVDEVMARTEGREVEREFTIDSPRRAIHEAAADADLVVVGARGHGAIGSALLGSVSSWVVQNATRATAVVPA